MIELTIKEKTTESVAWEDKLLELSVAYSMKTDPSITDSILIHSREKYIGTKEISEYLLVFEKFVYNWRRCACEG